MVGEGFHIILKSSYLEGKMGRSSGFWSQMNVNLIVQQTYGTSLKTRGSVLRKLLLKVQHNNISLYFKFISI